MSNSPLKISDLARKADTKVVTIRHYEKIGLLAEPDRSSSNYRTYDEDALSRLQFVRRYRSMGFSTDQIRDLLELSSKAERPCDQGGKLTAQHLEDVERKIADLTRLVNELRRISASYRGNTNISNCRTIDTITPN